ncbi:hypothetical protein BS333_00980 [Vibrio azureus]|uniref:TadE family protein n=1 Tax=Vibrio azureus NBRC 104587 TaxID=1219077 RepID=U3A6R2_9VIBR|nr:pilus assembly protein [Vibrio azureus]AUI85069.1 hypothetical protein BS333_00980 [Vibrio azureus]GAD75706.1 hypothetical protein VAZ01S_028_00600 [Vibrio azureus NBRC 104587]
MQKLTSESGSASVEAIFTIPILIYILIVMVGFLQYVHNESIFNYNITRALHLFDYNSIVIDNDLDASKLKFIESLNYNLNQSVINLDEDSLRFDCFDDLNSLINSSYSIECNRSTIGESQVIRISFQLDYKRFSWLFSKIFPDDFLGLSRELIILNESI